MDAEPALLRTDSVVATEEEVQPLMASLATLAALQTLRLGGSNLAFLGPDRCCELPASLTWLDLSAVRGGSSPFALKDNTELLTQPSLNEGQTDYIQRII